MINLPEKQIKLLKYYSTNVFNFALIAKINVPDIIKQYSNHLNEFTLDELYDYDSESEKELMLKFINSYTEICLPLHTCDIEQEYEKCEYSIDDVIENEVMDAMYCEDDIIKAKTHALIMSLTDKAYNEVGQFFYELDKYFDEVSSEKYMEVCLKVIENISGGKNEY